MLVGDFCAGVVDIRPCQPSFVEHHHLVHHLAHEAFQGMSPSPKLRHVLIARITEGLTNLSWCGHPSVASLLRLSMLSTLVTSGVHLRDKTCSKEEMDGMWSSSQEQEELAWTDLKVAPEELRPSFSLSIGQCFNWRQAAPDCWIGVLGRQVVAIRY